MDPVPAPTDTPPGSPAGPAPAPAVVPADDPDPAEVAAVMAEIAAGDTAAVWRFLLLADRPVRRQVRRELRRLRIPYTRDDLDGLVLDAVDAKIGRASCRERGESQGVRRAPKER